MTSARTETQLVCSMPTRMGLLADVAERLQIAEINIVAVSAYERDGEAKFLLVTSDHGKAAAALEGLGGEIREKSVVVADMPNKPGALAEAAKKIVAAGINIEYTYGTTSGGDMATVVFKTADDARTASLLS